LATASALAGDDLLVLNGVDNTLSSVDLTKGETSLGLASFPGFPNHAIVTKDRLYVVSSGSNQVFLFNKQTLAPLDTLFTGAGTNPFAVAVDTKDNVYVSLLLTNQVVSFDAFGNETARVAVGRSPEGILIVGGRLFVANSGFRFSDYGYDTGSVSVLKLESLVSIGTIAVGTNPQWMAADGTHVHVVCTGNYFSVFGEVHVFDAKTLLSLTTISVGGSPGYIALGDGQGFLSDYFSGVFSYDLASGSVIHGSGNPLSLGTIGYSGLTLDGKGNLFIALFEDDTVAKIRLSDESLAATFTTGDGPTTLVLRHDNMLATQNRHAILPRPEEVGMSRIAFAVRPQRNPVRGAVELSFPGDDGTDIQIALLDPQGRRVRLSPSVSRLELSGVPAGVYFLEAVQSGRRATSRLVVLP
jgi:sugar lactone lactonase YvrE